MRGFHGRQHLADGGVVQAIKRRFQSKPAQPQQPTEKPESPSPESLGNGMAGKAARSLADRKKMLEEAMNYADGGMVRGPGTGTSDDIETEVPEGSYIMPADSTRQVGEQNLAALGFGQNVPVNLSNGEYQMPPEQVHAVGVQALDQIKNATHTPVGQGAPKPEHFFAEGGVVPFEDEPRRRAGSLVPYKAQLPTPAGVPASTQATGAGTDPRNIQYVNSRGESARGFMPSSSREVVPAGPVTQARGATLPPPAPSAGVASQVEPDYKARAETMARAKADTAAFTAERAAQDARFDEAKRGASQPAAKPAQSRGFMPKKLGAMGGGATAMAALPEAVGVYDVATDENSTGMDVATQVAEGTGRTAAMGVGAAGGAKVGAMLGAMTGPAAPVAVPVLTAAGGLVGAGLGYWGADKAIKTGREMAGVDPSSPLERVEARSASGQIAKADTSAQPPAQGGGATASTGGDKQTEPEQPAANNVTREGNSYSGANIGPGFTINGQQPGGGWVEPVNAPAAGGTFQQQLANVRAMNAQGFNPRGDGPAVTVIPDSGRQEAQRRRAFEAASTAHRGAQNGQLTIGQINAMRGLINDEMSDATSRDNNSANNQAALERTVLSEQGANTRAASTNAIAGERLALDREAQGFTTRASQRVEKLYEQYEAAKTPDERSAIAEQIRVLNGKDQPARYAVAAGGQVVDPTTQQLVTQPAVVYNQQTGEIVQRGGGSALPPIAENPQVQAIMQNTSLSREERAKQIRALGYQ